MTTGSTIPYDNLNEKMEKYDYFIIFVYFICVWLCYIKKSS